MSDSPRPPSGKYPPLRPPRPTGPANRAIVEHQKLVQRQSDHEFKVNDDMRAVAEHLKRRESFDQDVAVSVAIVARELGIDDRLPMSVRSLAPPPLPRAAIDPKHPKRIPAPRQTPIRASAKNSARAAHASYAAIAVLVLDLLLEVARKLL